MRYLRKKKQIRKERRDRYSIRIPNDILLKKYIKGVASKFLSNPEVKLRLTMQFYKQYKAYAVTLNRRQKAKVACKIAAKKFVYTILSVRKFNAGLLIKHVRSVNSQSILSREDFGNACHTVSSEPFFYDTSYRHLADSSILKIDKKHKKLAFIKPNLNPEEHFVSGPIPVDENGKAHLFVSNVGDKVKHWSCSAMCRQISDEDVDAIVSISNLFQLPLVEVRESLENIDTGCPHGHHVKPHEMHDDMVDIEVVKLGHSLPCTTSGMCHSSLRILRAASVHYSALRSMLYNVYHSRKAHATISAIDNSLQNADTDTLRKLLEYEEIINDADADASCEDDTPDVSGITFTDLGLPNVETHLEIFYAPIIEEYNDKLSKDPEFACCSCERLMFRNNVTKFRYGVEKFKSPAWNKLNQYLITIDPDVVGKELYVCKYCRPLLNKDKVPNRCILNGLITEPIPNELAKLNVLERQLIQKAKVFQTVVRLGAYTSKIPLHSSLKAVKGTMFFLPLPMERTINDLISDQSNVLPDPELYILVDGQPTKDKVVWQTLVDVEDIKTATDKLKEINLFYQDVNDGIIDDSAKKTIEIVNSTSSKLSEKCSKEVVEGLQAYTIRKVTSRA